MKTVNLSQVPELYTAQRIKTNVIITLYDNIVELPPTDDGTPMQADIYQLKLPYREGLLSVENYEHMLEFAKRLTDPTTDGEARQARDVLL